MNIYILVAFLLLFLPLFFHGANKNHSFSFMSMEYTTVLRALAILMVMQQHLSGFVFGSRVFTPFGGGRSGDIFACKWIRTNNVSKKKRGRRLLEEEIR